jgi:hypothetical protein
LIILLLPYPAMLRCPTLLEDHQQAGSLVMLLLWSGCPILTSFPTGQKLIG